VLSWGEGTFLANGINIINPVDVSKLRVPGAEIRDALLPTPMVVLNIGLSETLSLEVFRAFDWDKTTIDPAGTYFSVNDIAGTDADRAMLGFGAVSDQTPLGTLPPGVGAIVPRARDRNPEGSEYGVAVRAILPHFDDTEIGLYFVSYHSRLPILNATTGAGSGLGASVLGGYAETGRYFLSYPENIRLYGLSFNSQLGTTGWSLQGEVSHRRNQPLQVDDLELLGAALTPLRNSALPALSALGNAYASGPTASQIGSFGDFEDIRGFVRRPVTQVQITAARVFGPTLGADRATLLGEFGVTHVHRMPEKSRLRLDGPATYASGNESQTATGLQPVTETAGHFADATSYGYRVVARLDFLGVAGGLNLSPRVQYQHDVKGVSPGPGGNFLQGRKAITLGLEATYLHDWRFDIAYTGFFGAGAHNLLRDRDFVAASIHHSF